MDASNSRRPRTHTPGGMLSLIALASIAACTSQETSARDTAAATGAVSEASAPTSDASADEEVQTYRLTMDKVNRYYDAHRDGTIAAGKRAQSEALEDLESIDALVKEIEREPKLTAAIRRSGISTHEFVVLTFALMTAMMAHEVLKLEPNANVDSLAREMEIPAANIHFVREHRAEIEAKGKAAEAAIRAAGVQMDE